METINAMLLPIVQNINSYLAGFFAVAITIALGFFGCMVQSNSIGSTIQTAFGVVFGEGLGAMFVAVCLFFFAFSTILGWNMFGKVNVVYMFGKKGVLPYTLISLVFIFLGTLMSSDLVWELTDMANYLMVLPNVIGLVAGTAVTVKLLKEGKPAKAKK